MTDEWIAGLRRNVLALVPVASGILLVLATSTPLYLDHVGEIMPRLGVTAVAYWTMFRPDLMGYVGAFVIGLLADLAIGAPLGSLALVLVLVRYVVLTRRRYFVGKPFHVAWLRFAPVVLAAACLEWTLASIYLFQWLDPVRVLVQALLTMVTFPPVYWLLARCQTVLLVPHLARDRG